MIGAAAGALALAPASFVAARRRRRHDPPGHAVRDEVQLRRPPHRRLPRAGLHPAPARRAGAPPRAERAAANRATRSRSTTATARSARSTTSSAGRRTADQKMKREFYPARRQGAGLRPRLRRPPLRPQPRQHRRPHARQAARRRSSRAGRARSSVWCPARRRAHAAAIPDNSVNMGTSYDCFDTRSHTLISRAARASNRLLLRDTLDRGRLRRTTPTSGGTSRCATSATPIATSTSRCEVSDRHLGLP